MSADFRLRFSPHSGACSGSKRSAPASLKKSADEPAHPWPASPKRAAAAAAAAAAAGAEAAAAAAPARTVRAVGIQLRVDEHGERDGCGHQRDAHALQRRPARAAQQQGRPKGQPGEAVRLTPTQLEQRSSSGALPGHRHTAGRGACPGPWPCQAAALQSQGGLHRAAAPPEAGKHRLDLIGAQQAVPGEHLWRLHKHLAVVPAPQCWWWCRRGTDGQAGMQSSVKGVWRR